MFYAFESGKVGTEMAYSAYIADDEKQTNSIRCMTRGDPKLAKNTKVTFEGVVKGGQWIDSCKLTAKK